MEELKKALLNHYHLSEEEYLLMSRPIEEIKLKDPNKIEGMSKIKERIFSAIANHEKIIIYGDYDCDGISATSIMFLTFQILHYPVSYYIPSRYIDGYGLNVSNVRKMKDAGYSLIICVDNGISQFDAIHEAKQLGIDVIVIDHHEVPEKQVEAYGIIHPTVSKIDKIFGSGGYMSLFVSGALLGNYDDYLVTLAGMSVVTDMMDLHGYNRDVVRLAVHNLEKNKYLALRLLLENPDVITEKSFGLEIGPKINAIGRVLETTKVNLLVKYLTTSSKDEIYELRDWIIGINDQRKELTKTSVEKLDEDYQATPGICTILNVKEGLIGLIAARLMNDYNVPTIVFTQDILDPTLLKGSIRSKEGFNTSKAIKSLEKYIVAGGGHSQAGGISIKKDNFDLFKEKFIELCEQYHFIVEEDELIPLKLTDITFENYEIIRSFAPFGMNFDEPLFSIENIPTRALEFISGGKHLSTALSIHSKLLGFNMKKEDVQSYSYIDVKGKFYLSSYRGGKTLEFRPYEYFGHNC